VEAQDRQSPEVEGVVGSERALVVDVDARAFGEGNPS
jgi:hypothetical protein